MSNEADKAAESLVLGLSKSMSSPSIVNGELTRSSKGTLSAMANQMSHFKQGDRDALIQAVKTSDISAGFLKAITPRINELRNGPEIASLFASSSFRPILITLNEFYLNGYADKKTIVDNLFSGDQQDRMQRLLDDYKLSKGTRVDPLTVALILSNLDLSHFKKDKQNIALFLKRLVSNVRMDSSSIVATAAQTLLQ